MKKSNVLTFVLAIVLIPAIVLTLTGCGSSSTDTDTNDSGTTTTTTTTKNPTLGDTITFDDLEIAFSTDYSFDTITNQYSDYYKESVIKIPVTVTNVGDEKNSLNMFYYDTFGSNGTELSSITAYFDDVIDYAGDLKPGASYDTNFYILYDGDGTYSIDFDNYSEQISVEFDITK